VELLDQLDYKILLTLSERIKADIADIQRVVAAPMREITSRLKRLKAFGLIREKKDGLIYYSLSIPILTKDELNRLLALTYKHIRVWEVRFKDVKLADIRDTTSKLFAGRISKENLEYIILTKILLEEFLSKFSQNGIIRSQSSDGNYIFAIEKEGFSIEEKPIWSNKVRIGKFIFYSAGIKNKLLSLPDYKNIDLIISDIESDVSFIERAVELGGSVKINELSTPKLLLALFEIMGYIEIKGESLRIMVPVLTSIDRKSISGLADSFFKTMKVEIDEFFKDLKKLYESSKLAEIGICIGDYNFIAWILFAGILMEKLIKEGYLKVRDPKSGISYAKWIEIME